MNYEFLKSPVRSLVTLLVAKEYEEVARMTHGIRLDASSIKTAIQDYGRDLSMPPDCVFEDLNIVEVRGAEPPQWSLHCDLWTEQEGRSDLTLELTAIKESENIRIELDDIHVL